MGLLNGRRHRQLLALIATASLAACTDGAASDVTSEDASLGSQASDLDQTFSSSTLEPEEPARSTTTSTLVESTSSTTTTASTTTTSPPTSSSSTAASTSVPSTTTVAPTTTQPPLPGLPAQLDSDAALERVEDLGATLRLVDDGGQAVGTWALPDGWSFGCDGTKALYAVGPVSEDRLRVIYLELQDGGVVERPQPEFAAPDAPLVQRGLGCHD